MKINCFKHPELAVINKNLKPLVEDLRSGGTIQAIHTPIVSSDEIGGYARSLDFLFKKYIAIDCNRFLKETPEMQEFILARQVALFDKSSRCLHLPLAAIAVGTSAVASSILFPFSTLAMVAISAIVVLASAVIVAKRERKNELYVDLEAFEMLNNSSIYEIKKMKDVLLHFENVGGQCPKRSLFQNIFSRYPSAIDRLNQLKTKNLPVSASSRKY